MAKIIINRSSEKSNKFRKIEIFLEDKKIGTIKDGETKEFDIQPGEHVLTAKIDWCKSNDLIVSIKDGETKSFDLSGTNPNLALFYITVGKDKYLTLKASDD